MYTVFERNWVTLLALSILIVIKYPNCFAIPIDNKVKIISSFFCNSRKTKISWNPDNELFF